MAKQFTLGKKERLKSRKSIERLFSEGNKFVVNPYRIFYGAGEGDQPLQFGAGVGTKNFRKAVDRNRIKRLTKEAYRLQKMSLEEILRKNNSRLHLFFIYTGKDLPVYKDVFEKVGKALMKLEKIVTIVK